MEVLSTSLAANRQRLAARLRWPENIGMIIRDVTIPATPPVPGLLLWVEGLASADALEVSVLAPLAQKREAAPVRSVLQALPIHQREFTREMGLLVHRLTEGWAVLLADGEEQALLLEVTSPHQHKAQKGAPDPNPNADIFGAELRGNVAHMRKRLRTADLLALPVRLKRPKAGAVALLYIKGKADPAVVRKVRRWARLHAGEEAATRGNMSGLTSVLGLVPAFDIDQWPDRAAMLLDTGHVLLMVDRVARAYAAPVTLATFLLSNSDVGLGYPVKRWLSRARLLLCLLVLLLPGMVVALMNYHQEMVPTPFLLSVASTRENAPFPIIFEVLLLEAFTEISREASFRLPVAVPIGSSVVATVLILLLAVQTGFVGPLPALAAMVGALASLALPSYGGTYLIRLWRFVFAVAAVILGVFGIAAVFSLLLTYLCQTRSWGVPFFGASGVEFTGQAQDANRPPDPKGGKRFAKGQPVVR